MWIGLVCLYGVLKGVRDIIKKKNRDSPIIPITEVVYG